MFVVQVVPAEVAWTCGCTPAWLAAVTAGQVWLADSCPVWPSVVMAAQICSHLRKVSVCAAYNCGAVTAWRKLLVLWDKVTGQSRSSTTRYAPHAVACEVGEVGCCAGSEARVRARERRAMSGARWSRARGGMRRCAWQGGALWQPWRGRRRAVRESHPVFWACAGRSARPPAWSPSLPACRLSVKPARPPATLGAFGVAAWHNWALQRIAFGAR